MNPFTKKYYSETAINLRENQILRFPTADPLILKEFDKKYINNDILIIKAATGTGKGVVIAPRVMFLENVKPNNTKAVGLDRFDNGELLSPSHIVVTEPRTPNTLVANHLKEVLDAPIVNYSYKFDNNLTDNTLLAFVTDGFLVNFFYRDINLPDYNCVIIDEVHERNKNIDQILCFLKLTKKKTILLSATIDIDTYKNYFNAPIIDRHNLFNSAECDLKKNIASMDIHGVTHKIEDVYYSIEEDYITQSLRIIKKICEDDKPGDILIFLASASELMKACRQIYKMNLAVACMELHRSTQDSMKEVIIDEVKYKSMKFNNRDVNRKVVFSTNVAESGITINGIIYVIDSGRRYESTFSPADQIYELKNRFISQSEADQRRGRAGRTNPGICYHLYSRADYENMSAFKSPDIETEEISDITLSLLASNFCVGRFNYVDFIFDNMLTPPLDSQKEYTKKLLYKLGIISQVDGSTNALTRLGVEVAKIGLDLQEAITYIAGRSFKIEYQICQIMAMLSVEPNIIKWFVDEPRDDKMLKKWQRSINRWRSAIGDIFVLSDLFNEFRRNSSERWCHDNFLIYNKFTRAQRQFYQLQNTMKNIIPMFDDFKGTTNEKIIEAFCRGYPLNVAVATSNNIYSVDRPVHHIKVDRPVTLTKLTKKILYLDIRKIAGEVKISNLINL